MNSKILKQATKKAKSKWNKSADEFNQWRELGQDEKDELISKEIPKQ